MASDRATCPRCGITRQVKCGRARSVCRDCRETITPEELAAVWGVSA